ncbi:hypothetical protein [Phaffia rhodozyma]|uniref:Uncharacterized protein n=1 Tax=Phaffia rhodozyma TaxID=264483 RepID=A0A0F7SQZ8_PHARH|nr:hypothetical protein [Phaffia rhodozyma]
MLSRLKSKLQNHHLLSVQFDSDQVYTAGDDLSGLVLFDPTDLSKRNISQIVVQLRCTQYSTYRNFNTSVSAFPLGGNELASETSVIYCDEINLYQPSSDFLPSASKGMEIPFVFHFPLLPSLPPSFEAGTRSEAGPTGRGKPTGTDVGSSVYTIDVIGRRPSSFAINERVSIPFTYAPPCWAPYEPMPPPIYPPMESDQQTLPILPPPCPSESEGWHTTRIEKDFRSTIFGKIRFVQVALTTPEPLAAVVKEKIPYYLSITTLSPPITDRTQSPSQSYRPSPSSLKLSLVRVITTTAKGMRQAVRQTIHEDILDIKNEARIWYCPTEETDHVEPNKMIERRMKAEIVVVGEMKTGDNPLIPSFDSGIEGKLTCSYTTHLYLPIKGVSPDVNISGFMPFKILSSIPFKGIFSEPGAQNNDALPEYSYGRQGHINYSDGKIAPDLE